MEAENMQEKKIKSFSFGCLVTSHENVAERMADAGKHTDGKLKHRGSIIKVRSRMQALRSTTHTSRWEKQQGVEEHQEIEKKYSQEVKQVERWTRDTEIKRLWPLR